MSLNNSLGPFEFVAFHVPSDHGAPPDLLQVQGDLVQRAGVDGSSVMRLGRKGNPFQMRSGIDLLSLSDALVTLNAYKSYVNFEPLALVWGGIDFHASFGTDYLPIAVEPIRIRRISGGAGGQYGSTAAAWLEALWTLVPIAIS